MTADQYLTWWVNNNTPEYENDTDATIAVMQAYNRHLAELLEYLYACHSSGANLMDHVEDEIKQIIEEL